MKLAPGLASGNFPFTKNGYSKRSTPVSLLDSETAAFCDVVLGLSSCPSLSGSDVLSGLGDDAVRDTDGPGRFRSGDDIEVQSTTLLPVDTSATGELDTAVKDIVYLDIVNVK